jgi:hypothetical protein
MTKSSVVLAALLVLASALPNVAFAAITSSRTALSQGEAIDRCRDQENPQGGMNDHHARPGRVACVQRLMHASQSTSY